MNDFDRPTDRGADRRTEHDADPGIDPGNKLSSDGPHGERYAVARMIDASANRLTEALRVIEDYARYGLDDYYLMTALKNVRHEVTACVQSVIETHWRAVSRDTQNDIGTHVTTDSETDRADLQDVIDANFCRAQQAARSLEECLKILSPAAAATLEQTRYQLYTLHKAVLTTAHGQRALRDVTICAIVDGGDSLQRFTSHVDRLLEAGVDAIQLRDKRLSDRALVERGRRLCMRTKERPVLAVINDRPDLAALCRADGVHLGQDDLSVAEARRIVGACGLIGVSTHALCQAHQAVLDGADYVGVGPMFATETKQIDRLAGPQLLQQVDDEIGLPQFAIGGILPANIDQIAAAGGTRIAVSAALSPQNPDLVQTVSALRKALGRRVGRSASR
jgi:thiamine-phosphate pyrophosphorylase